MKSASLCFSCSRLLGYRCFGPLLSFIIGCSIGGLLILSRLISIILCNLTRFALLAILFCTFISNSRRICLRLICIVKCSLLCGIILSLVCYSILISLHGVLGCLLLLLIVLFNGSLQFLLSFSNLLVKIG